jgi:amino-acid N-acetyltransferase
MTGTHSGPATLTDARELLIAASLPTADLDGGTHADFLAMRSPRDGIIGVVGVEPHGADGLLRSLTVNPAHRCAGLGAQLVDALEVHADRASAPAAIRATPEFSGLCPSSAACMAKVL